MNHKLMIALSVLMTAPFALHADLKSLGERLKKAASDASALAKKGKDASMDDIKGLFRSGSDIKDDVTNLVGKPKVYPTDTKTSLELKNKGDLIFVTVKAANRDYSSEGKEVFEVKPGKTVALSPDITDGLELAVYKEMPTSNDAVPVAQFKTAPQRTAYLTWDNKVLRPQTGPAGGRLGITDTGLSLRKNVESSEVTKIDVVQKTPVKPAPARVAPPAPPLPKAKVESKSAPVMRAQERAEQVEVEKGETTTSEGSRGDLLAQIREGKKLKSVNKTTQPVQNKQDKSLAGALSSAMDKRRRAIEGTSAA